MDYANMSNEELLKLANASSPAPAASQIATIEPPATPMPAVAPPQDFKSMSDADLLNMAGIQPQQSAPPGTPQPDPKMLEGQVSSGNPFFDALGAAAHGVAEGGYRSLDAALAPMNGLSRGIYKTVTGNEPAEQRINFANDLNQIFAPPKDNEPIQAIGRSIVPGAIANFIAPGSGLAGLAVNGAVGNALTSTGDQYAQTGNVNPLQVAGEAALGAITNPIATKALNGLWKQAGKFIPIPFKNAAANPTAISNATQAATGRPLNVIDPSHLDAEDLAAHQLLNSQIQLPQANVNAAPIKDASAIAAAEKIASQQALKEKVLNVGRQITGKPMGSYPLQVRNTLGEIGMVQPQTPVAHAIHRYLDTSHLMPKPMGSYPITHVGSVHELPMRPSDEAQALNHYLDTAATAPRKMGDYPLMHVGHVHELGTAVGKIEKQAKHNYVSSKAIENGHIPNLAESVHAVYGDSRYVAQAYGRGKVFQEDSRPIQETIAKLSKMPGFDVQTFEQATKHLGTLKAHADHDEAVLQNFAHKIIEKYGGDVKTLEQFGIKLTKSGEVILPREVKQDIANHRSGLPTTPEPRETKDSLSSILGKSFGHEDGDYRLFSEQLSGDKKEDFKRLLSLKDKLDGSAKRKIEGSAKAYEASSKEALPIIRDAHNALKQVTGDPMARLHVNSVVRHPMGRQHGMLDYSVDYVHSKQIYDLTAGALKAHRDFAAAAKAAIKEPRIKSNIKIDARSAALAAGAGLLSLDQSANAADGQEHKHNRTLSNIGMTLIAGAAVHRFGPAAVSAFLKNEKLWFASSLFKDTLDHVEYLDSLLSKGGQGLVRDILHHQAAAIQSQFGVKFENQNVKALAYNLLKEKAITGVEALAGKPGTIFESMTPEQRRAVVQFHLNRSTLVGKVTAYKKEVSDYIAKNSVKNGLVNDAASALDHLQKSLTPTGGVQHPGDKFLQERLSNAMDYFFFLNPKFHLLNLSDMFISGASRVGATNIFKANAMLAADRNIAKAFGHSNIVGSFKAERTAQSVKAGRAFELPDIPSDRINADRVTLASFLNYFDKNPQKMKALGYSSPKQFVKAVISGNADPTLSMDAWAHAAEVGSRTLGVDPFRVNSDYVSRMASAPAIGVFVKQPARIARLALKNIADGNLSGFYTGLAFAALIGGNAAIPNEIREVWSAVDPEGSYQAQKDLNSISVVRNLTGMDVSSKLETSIFYPAQAALSPGYANLMEGPGAIADLAAAAMALKDVHTWQDVVNDQKLMKSADKLFSVVTSGFVPRIAGFPTRQIQSIGKTVGIMKNGKERVSYYQPGAKFPSHPTDEFDLKDYGISGADVMKEAFLPGESNFAADLKQAERERATRKFRGDDSAPVYDRPQILFKKQKLN